MIHQGAKLISLKITVLKGLKYLRNHCIILVLLPEKRDLKSDHLSVNLGSTIVGVTVGEKLSSLDFQSPHLDQGVTLDLAS